MRMRLIITMLLPPLWAALQGAQAFDPCIGLPTLAAPSAAELPACGNGLLDEGEVCDDGNRVGGDGCNAWCSGFDRMTRACTMAGQNPFYASPGDQRQCLAAVSGSFGPAQAFFCNLNAITAAPDGKYLVVAEGGLLVRMDLFTDDFSSSLSILPATLVQPLARVCSIFVVPSGGVLVHECQEQSLILYVNGGTQFSKPFAMPQLRPHVGRMRSFLDGDLLVLAGLTVEAGDTATTCVQVYGFNVTGSSSGGSLLANIECVVYNVVEKGLMYPSFSIAGMVPYQVTKDSCPFQMQSAACYVVHMRRADMQVSFWKPLDLVMCLTGRAQVLRAYLAVDGGLDMHYTVSTDAAANVLGAPLMYGGKGQQQQYTLTGNCFTLQQRRHPALKRPPPMVALGNACGPMPFQPSAAQCSTPLNNPFITEVASSSYLLPQGLSSRLQHQSLLQIFNASHHLPLYRQILDNTHDGTVPLDFVELPGTLDVVYITRTTIGLISTKGIVHMDLFNPGYCRASPALLCPAGFFGSVDMGVCRECGQAGDVTSVSAQMQCAGHPQYLQRRRLLGLPSSSSSFQSAPYTHMGLIVSKDVTQALLDMLTKYYLVRKGQNCTRATPPAMTAHEPYNMQADYTEAQLQPPEKQLITRLIAEASARDLRDYSTQTSEEYLVGWTAQESALIEAVAAYVTYEITPRTREQLEGPCGMPRALIDALEQCRGTLSDFHRRWLPCALPIAQAIDGGSQKKDKEGRRLLQMSSPPPPVVVVEHSQCTFMSATTVTYRSSTAGDRFVPSAPRPNPLQPPSSGGSGGGNEGDMWLVLGGVAGGLLVSALLVLVLYLYCLGAPTSGYKTA
jgi:cysteine-rich repeat protein